MKVTVVITVLNEEKSIQKLLDALLAQAKKSDEIIVIDAGSKDDTNNIVRRYASKYTQQIKLLIKNNISRSKGRNLGTKLAKHNIIVMIDAGCVPKHNWLKNITAPFKKYSDKELSKEELVVAGFYIMVGKTTLEKAFACYLGTMPDDFNENFLPSTRSIAFTKSAWKKVGGFPTHLKGAAEDTVFSYKLLKQGIKIVRVKNARVEWGMPKNLLELAKKVFSYARGDVQSKIFYNEAKDIESHNIKVILVFMRYLIALMLIFLALVLKSIFPVLLVIGLSIFYIYFSFFKIFRKTRRVKIALWGPIVQITCDLAVMWGFIQGIIS